ACHPSSHKKPLLVVGEGGCTEIASEQREVCLLYQIRVEIVKPPFLGSEGILQVKPLDRTAC
ncbi:hypothetical protein LDC_2069, partial [sediment metagenome]